MTYEPKNYVKGGRVKTAYTPTEEVRLEFDGFKPADEVDPAEGANYNDLREQAKALGVPVKGSKKDLAEAIKAKAVEVPEDGGQPAVVTPELKEDPPISDPS